MVYLGEKMPITLRINDKEIRSLP